MILLVSVDCADFYDLMRVGATGATIKKFVSLQLVSLRRHEKMARIGRTLRLDVLPRLLANTSYLAPPDATHWAAHATKGSDGTVQRVRFKAENSWGKRLK